MRFSLIMPAYNAAAHIEATVARIPSEVWSSLISLWIVNDGSRDRTGEVIDNIAAQNSLIKALQSTENHGYGAAVRKGLMQCRDEACDAVVCLHADGQYAPEQIPALVGRMQRDKVDILQGSRIASGTALSGGMPLYKFVANRALTFFENLVFGLHLTDYHSGMLCYSRRALDMIDFDRLSDSFDFDLEVIASARARGLTIAEHPIPTHYGDEVSNVKSIPYGLRCVRVMGRYLVGRYDRGQRSEVRGQMEPREGGVL